MNEDTNEDTNIGEISNEQAEFLKSLEAEEAEVDAESANHEEAETESVTDEKNAQMTALGGLGVIEFTLKKFIHPDFEFTRTTKDYAVENLSPVLIKYGALIPSWAVEYEPEIKAVMAVGTLVSEGIDTAKNLKAKDAAISDDKQHEEGQKESVRVAA